MKNFFKSLFNNREVENLRKDIYALNEKYKKDIDAFCEYIVDDSFQIRKRFEKLEDKLDIKTTCFPAYRFSEESVKLRRKLNNNESDLFYAVPFDSSIYDNPDDEFYDFEDKYNDKIDNKVDDNLISDDKNKLKIDDIPEINLDYSLNKISLNNQLRAEESKRKVSNAIDLLRLGSVPLTCKNIARQSGLSEPTIRKHYKNFIDKFDKLN